jgi:diaminopimelate decarboxylase
MSAGVFRRVDGELHVESVALADIAESFGTPCYVYSRAAIEQAYSALRDALVAHPSLICYAVKANPTLAILNLLARLGAGFDIVSGGELERVVAAGGDPARAVFSGVGKSEAELRLALALGIRCFNVESESELMRLDRVARDLGKTAPVALRVNPDVDPKTHPYISTGLKENKFGIPFADARALYARAATLPGLRVVGLDCHIGSQLTELAPLQEAALRVLALADELAAMGISLHHIDLGGGLGVRYRDESPPSFADYGAMLRECMHGRSETLLVEPGRALVGEAGVLLTRVEYLKRGADRNFAIVDAAMNDLMRPALYDAWHEVREVRAPSGARERYDIVGPVCESGDFIARDRMLSLQEGALLAVMTAGAYGMSMSSNYNTRPRAAEVMVDGSHASLVRERESVGDLFRLERMLEPRTR